MDTSTPTIQLSPGETVSIETITPEIAAQMLEHNKNRTLRPTQVAQFAAAMARGEWRVTNDAISFRADGVLVNGQHRLSGVVLSGVTIQSLVLRNARPETQSLMDIGTKRTYQDHLQIKEGNRHVQNLSSFLRLYMVIEDLFTGPKRKVDVALVVNHLIRIQPSFARLDAKRAEMPDCVDALSIGRRLTYTRRENERPLNLGHTGVAMGVLLTRRASKGTMNDVALWEEGLITGTNLGENDPRLKLRNLKLMVNRSRRVDMVKDVIAYTKCFNAWVKGDTIKTVRITEEDIFLLPIGTDPFAD